MDRGKLPGRGGGPATTQTLTLKSSGMNLTGTFDGGRGMPADISEGMVHDSDVYVQSGHDHGPGWHAANHDL